MNYSPQTKDNDDKDDFSYSRYAEAVENVLEKVPVKNGVVSIESIQMETSLPLDLIKELLDRGDVEFPDRVEKIQLRGD